MTQWQSSIDSGSQILRDFLATKRTPPPPGSRVPASPTLWNHLTENLRTVIQARLFSSSRAQHTPVMVRYIRIPMMGEKGTLMPLVFWFHSPSGRLDTIVSDYHHLRCVRKTQQKIFLNLNTDVFLEICVVQKSFRKKFTKLLGIFDLRFHLIALSGSTLPSRELRIITNQAQWPLFSPETLWWGKPVV